MLPQASSRCSSCSDRFPDASIPSRSSFTATGSRAFRCSSSPTRGLRAAPKPPARTARPRSSSVPWARRWCPSWARFPSPRRSRWRAASPAARNFSYHPTSILGGTSMKQLHASLASAFAALVFAFPALAQQPHAPRGPLQPFGLGSGFIVSADGFIVTNAHVVENAEEINVRLNDKREFKAKVIGADLRSDVAVIKIEGTNLPTVKIGDLSK